MISERKVFFYWSISAELKRDFQDVHPKKRQSFGYNSISASPKENVGGQVDKCDKNQATVLVNSSDHSRTWRHTVQNASKQHIHGKYYILKANTWRLKNESCNRNEPKQYTNKC